MMSNMEIEKDQFANKSIWYTNVINFRHTSNRSNFIMSIGLD